MFRSFCRKFIFFQTLIFCVYSSNGQKSRAIFIGLQPAITVEPEYEKNEFDINIVPIVFQSSLSKRIDYRLVSIVNYHFSSSGNEFSDLGLEIGFPVFFKAKEELLKPSSGFFASPVFQFVRNVMNDHYTMILAIEPGYFFELNSRFAFSLQLQFGGSYFIYDSDVSNEWKTHFGFKGNLGFWLNKPKE